jgi:uncharacterized protein
MSRAAQFAVFFAFATLVLTAVHTYLWLRLVRNTELPPPWRLVATFGLVALLLSVPAAMTLDRVLPSGFLRTAGVAPFVWMGAMLLFVFWFAAADLARVIAFAATKFTGSAFLVEHRLVIARAVAVGGLGVVALLTIVSLWNAAREPVVTTIEIRLSRLPRALDGFTIVQLSDMHIGGSRGDRAWVEGVVARVNAMEPDLVAMTGDLVDAPPEHILSEVAPMAELRARHGAYFVTGNHEFYTGLAEWLPQIRKLGMRVLRNERVAIGDGAASFDLLGVDDPSASGLHGMSDPNLAKIVAGRDSDRVAVLLAHQPRAARDAAGLGIDLVLSGHTHGGQIWPFSALVRLQQPYLRGLYRVSERTRLYVTDGTGTWGPPMRLGTRNEIVRVVLRSATSE